MQQRSALAALRMHTVKINKKNYKKEIPATVIDFLYQQH
jgi:hypothetical protein